MARDELPAGPIGVVSLLDETNSRRVEAIWSGLETHFGLRAVQQATPLPHMSYLVADNGDLEALRESLSSVARHTAPFTVHASGLGLFTGLRLILYAPIARNLALGALHERLLPSFLAAAENPWAYYLPDRWIPHITLAYQDLTPEMLPDVVSWLQREPLDWEVRVSSLSLIVGDGGSGLETVTVPLSAP